MLINDTFLHASISLLNTGMACMRNCILDFIAVEICGLSHRTKHVTDSKNI